MKEFALAYYVQPSVTEKRKTFDDKCYQISTSKPNEIDRVRGRGSHSLRSQPTGQGAARSARHSGHSWPGTNPIKLFWIVSKLACLSQKYFQPVLISQIRQAVPNYGVVDWKRQPVTNRLAYLAVASMTTKNVLWNRLQKYNLSFQVVDNLPPSDPVQVKLI
jgi:hypothetical protein